MPSTLFLGNSSIYASSLLHGKNASLLSGHMIHNGCLVVQKALLWEAAYCHGEMPFLSPAEVACTKLQRTACWSPSQSAAKAEGSVRCASKCRKMEVSETMLRPALCKNFVLIYSLPVLLSVPFCGSEGHKVPKPLFLLLEVEFL